MEKVPIITVETHIKHKLPELTILDSIGHPASNHKLNQDEIRPDM